MPPSIANPFRPAEQVAPKIKAFVFGASGVGKTFLALTSPGKIAVIDTEGGTAFYARRLNAKNEPKLSPFDVLPTKTYRDVQNAVQYLAAHPTEYATLVIDPVTVIYETLQDAAQIKRGNKRGDADADLEMLDWQRIKRAYKSLMNELINLPMHVIVIAREKDEVVRKGNDTEKIGVKPDAEKGTAYFFDTIVRIVVEGERRTAHVLKDRTGAHVLGAVLESPTFDALFAKAIRGGKGVTAGRNVPSDDAAARTDADTTMSWSQDVVRTASVAAGISKARAQQALDKVGAGRPTDEFTSDDWRDVAAELDLPGATNGRPAELPPTPPADPVTGEVLPAGESASTDSTAATTSSPHADGGGEAGEASPAAAEQTQAGVAAAACDDPSPHTLGELCGLAPGHANNHRSRNGESWEPATAAARA